MQASSLASAPAAPLGSWTRCVNVRGICTTACAPRKAYVYWIRLYVRWSGLRHPRDMGEAQVKGFLTMLATQRHASSSTHNQALSALRSHTPLSVAGPCDSGRLRRGLGEVRNLPVQARPGLGARRPDVEHRGKRRCIVERRKPDGRELWVGVAFREQGRTAFRAKAALGPLPAAAQNGVGSGRAADLKVSGRYNDAGCKGRATRLLAVAAVAVQHGDGRAGACVSDRAARTAAGERSLHRSDCRAWPAILAKRRLTGPSPPRQTAPTRNANTAARIPCAPPARRCTPST